LQHDKRHTSPLPQIFLEAKFGGKFMSKKCENCKRCATNDDMTNVIMSSADWQRNEQRHLRREKRFVAIIVLLVLLFVGSNVGWMIYENSFEDVVITQENDDGYNNYIGKENPDTL
jgi:hypothetical protein